MNTFDVIIGALIGMVVSLLTSLVSHWLESSRNNRTRRWQIEDRQTEETSIILRDRAKEIEGALNYLRDFVIKKTEREKDLLRIIVEDTTGELSEILFAQTDHESKLQKVLRLKQIDEEAFNKISKNFLQHVKNEQLVDAPDLLSSGIGVLLSNVASFNHNTLSKDVKEYIDTVTGRTSLFLILQLKYVAGENIDVQKEGDLIVQHLADIVFLHGKIINQLDSMRATGKYEEKRDGKRI